MLCRLIDQVIRQIDVLIYNSEVESFCICEFPYSPYPPDRDAAERCFELHQLAIDSIVAASDSLFFSLGQFGNVAPVITREHRNLPFEKRLSEGDGSEYLKFQFELPDKIEFDADKKSSEIESKEITKMIAERLVITRIEQLAVVANIAFPGSIYVSQTYSEVDDRRSIEKHSTSTEHIRIALESWLVKQNTWPPIKTLGLSDVWKWAQKNAGFLDGFGGHRIDRALNCFVKTMDSTYALDDSIIMWSLIGIESLIATGTSGLSAQVRDKLLCLFPDIDSTIKKKLDKLYNHRSRFVHGDLPISTSLVVHDASPEFEKIEMNSIRAQSNGTAILVALLQLLAEKKATEFRFRYEYETL